ncbi:hypothetical protein, partial [Leptolyngbya sp. FACHB-238]|uniref:hypothetical protein n=1 Tax=Leptolyngbya sp. FACHB-238 TaxID=2692804 RepID=UPI001A7EB374
WIPEIMAEGIPEIMADEFLLRDDRKNPEEGECDLLEKLRCTAPWSAIWFRNYGKQSCQWQK